EIIVGETPAGGVDQQSDADREKEPVRSAPGFGHFFPPEKAGLVKARKTPPPGACAAPQSIDPVVNELPGQARGVPSPLHAAPPPVVELSRKSLLAESVYGLAVRITSSVLV